MIETAEARDEARGKEKDKAEEKVEIAKNLLQVGVDVKLISKSTGLITTEVELVVQKGK